MKFPYIQCKRKRWNKWEKGWYDKSEQMGHTPEETEEIITAIMLGQYPRNIWKYNQIVGFVELVVHGYHI